jgi:glycosyltransferase involved in cell wall biosynthesis
VDSRALRVEISVVIPTYNRMDTLPRVIKALEEQWEAPPFEVIIVDDGSSDGTSEWLARSRFALPLRAVSQANRGPAAARNRGIDLAAGHLVALLGDDTMPEPSWLATHARAHRERRTPCAVVGYTRWHERIIVTPFLRYINEKGLQFGYALIEDREDVAFNFFYSSNVSLPHALLAAERFDERFPYPTWEDTELGYRLTRRRGMRLAYCPEAVTAHDHATTLTRFMSRQEKAGYSAVLFARLHPELGDFLGVGPAGPPELPARGWQVLREWIACRTERLPIAMPAVWKELLRYHYIRGLHRGWADRERWPVADPRSAQAVGATVEVDPSR